MSEINLIYLASPFSDPERSVREMRYEVAIKATAALLGMGIFTYSPIVHNHVIAVTHHLPNDFEFWKDFDELMISRCDTLLVLTIPGWRESKGVAQEIVIATKLGKPVKYVDMDKLIWHPAEVKVLLT